MVSFFIVHALDLPSEGVHMDPLHVLVPWGSQLGLSSLKNFG
jgi:hypothetical protein